MTTPAPTPQAALVDAARAVCDRWDSPAWKWGDGPTADLIATLRAALAQAEAAQPVESWGWHAGDGTPAHPAERVAQWPAHNRERMRFPLYAAPQPAEAAPANPMDWPLPCDVRVGHGTMRKGVRLGTLVARMKVLYEMATGEKADKVAALTDAEKADRMPQFLADLAAGCKPVARSAAEAAPKQGAVTDERAAFEKWAKAHGRIFLNRRGEGYIHQFTMEAWVAWQARAALAAQPQQPAPEPVAWLCELAQEDSSTRTQIVTENPDGLRWNDAGEPSPFRVTPLYAAPQHPEAAAR